MLVLNSEIGIRRIVLCQLLIKRYDNKTKQANQDRCGVVIKDQPIQSEYVYLTYPYVPI
jgi:hypothetical protein